jgi:RNA polymerase sigma-70 factor (ECF subfamily)
MTQTDETLLRRIQQGDNDAVELLHTHYASALQRHVRSMVHNDEASADLVQEIFVRVWQRAELWSAPGSVKAWLYKIASNLALNHLRNRRRRPEQPLEPPIEYHAAEGWQQEPETRVPGRLIDAAALQPEALLTAAERKDQLWRLVDELPQDKRQVFHLVYESEMDLRSVADALEIPEGTVKSRLYHGKRHLTRRWIEGGFDY